MFRLLIIVFLVCAGCSTRAYTKSRSELAKEAAARGDPTRSPAEEWAIYQKQEEKNSGELSALLGERLREMTPSDEYLVGPGDEIEIHVFDVPELNVVARVSEAGWLNLPLVGSLPAHGKGLNQLRDELALRLSKFVKAPQVTIDISSYSSQKVAVLGAVRKPGVYPLKKGRSSLVELLGEAGGIAPTAGGQLEFYPVEKSGLAGASDIEARARLAFETTQGIRGAGIEIPVDEIMGTAGGVPIDLPVRGGDMLVIPEAGQVLVEGEVQKSGSFQLGQRMTLLGALASSGGITPAAKVDEVEIVRELPEAGRVSLLVDLEKVALGEARDVRLRSGDIIRVPSDAGRRMRQDTFESIGHVLNIGVGGHMEVR